MTGRVVHVLTKEMTVTFSRRGRVCSWTALRPPRSLVPGPSMAAGGDLPHDLATFVIEGALQLRHGFWGCVAEGATFASLARKRTPQGKAVIARHRAALDEAEVLVNDVFFAWRGGRPTRLDDELDAMLERWRAVPEGGELVLHWPPTPRPPRDNRPPSIRLAGEGATLGSGLHENRARVRPLRSQERGGA